tara:strand:+ start:296 stop:583 length:288 start_codon:yes stop_codon:yes gene_type:complete
MDNFLKTRETTGKKKELPLEAYKKALEKLMNTYRQLQEERTSMNMGAGGVSREFACENMGCPYKELNDKLEEVIDDISELREQNPRDAEKADRGE